MRRRAGKEAKTIRKHLPDPKLMYRDWPTRDRRTFLAWVPERNGQEFRQDFARFLIGDGDKGLGTWHLPPFYALIEGMTIRERRDLLVDLGKRHISDQVAMLNKKLGALPPDSKPLRLLRELNCTSVKTPEQESQFRRFGYSVREIPTQVSLGWVESVYELRHKPPHATLAKQIKPIEAGSDLHREFLSRFPKLRSPHGSLGDIALMLWRSRSSLNKEESEHLKKHWAAREYRRVKKVRDQLFDRSLMGLLIGSRNQDRKAFREFIRALIAEQIGRQIQDARFARGAELSEGCMELGLRAELSREEVVFTVDELVLASLTQGGSATAMSQICCLYACEPVGLLEWLESFLLRQHKLRNDPRHQSLKQLIRAWPGFTRHLSQFNRGPSLDELLEMVSDLGPSPISVDAQTRRLQREGLKLRERSTTH